mmetsp:Transcript_13341/g.20838  ORF Transcript_13341/g.20838 Transcript_13341/m.20838 type:complete len:186 (+) Transcript_13341:5165-5722(+)
MSIISPNYEEEQVKHSIKEELTTNHWNDVKSITLPTFIVAKTSLQAYEDDYLQSKEDIKRGRSASSYLLTRPADPLATKETINFAEAALSREGEYLCYHRVHYLSFKSDSMASTKVNNLYELLGKYTSIISLNPTIGNKTELLAAYIDHLKIFSDSQKKPSRTTHLRGHHEGEMSFGPNSSGGSK